MDDLINKFKKGGSLNLIGVILFWAVFIGVGWLIFGHHHSNNANTSATQQSQTQSVAPTLNACDRLPSDYITNVMSSSVTDKQESNTAQGPGTQCWVQGTIANGPAWILDYTIVPTSTTVSTSVTKQSDSTGWWYAYQSGQYQGTLLFTTKGTSPADDQIAHDLTNALAQGLSNQ